MAHEINEFIQDKFAALCNDVDNGNESGLKALAILKEAANIIKMCIEQVEPIALDEAKKYNEKTFEFSGYSFTFTEGRKNFDFKNCQTWAIKKKEITEIEETLKAAWSAASKNVTQVDGGTGELIELPTVTFSKESLSIKAPKLHK